MNRKKPAFPVRVSANGPYFEDQNGKPFFWQGDTCWRLFWMLSDEEARRYLRDRAEKDFTVILVHMLPHRIYETNRYGESPFMRQGRIDQPNEQYFVRAERIVEYAAELGLAMAIAPMWLSVWEDDWHRYYHDKAAVLYMRYVAQRFGAHANVISFIHGGDDDALSLHDQIRRCALEAKKHAPSVLSTFHAGIGPSYPFFGKESWYDFCFNYSYDYNQFVIQMLEARKRHPDKPVLLGETHYEGNEGITSAVLRKYAYTSVILGGSGHCYGNKEIWQGSMFFFENLWTAGSGQMIALKEFFDRNPIYGWKPDLDGRIFQTIRALMPGASEGLIPAVISKDGQEIVAYCSDLRYFCIKRKGAWAAVWIDPVSGRQITFSVKSGEQMGVPGRNAGGDPDWLLLLRLSSDEIESGYPRTKRITA